VEIGNRRQLPLEGVTVIALEQAVAAPLCTRHLAEQGARVIKIERPGEGDFARGYDTRVKGLSSHFVWANRSKESLTLNIKSEAGQHILHQLLSKADVFVQNLAPDACSRLGLSFSTLHSRYPGLIVCDISGYGQGGPYQHKKAYDLLIQSESGFLSVTGSPEEGGMAKAGCSVADISAGMYAYSSIMSALLLRARTGEGSHIDVSMLECLVEWMGHPLYYSFEGAQPPPRAGASHATIYPYGPFPIGDGGVVMLGLQNNREWKVFCEQVLQDDSLASDPLYVDVPLRSEHRIELSARITAAFRSMSTQEVVNRLDNVGIANALVNNMADVWAHPQLKARGRWQEVQTPAGAIPSLKAPGIWFEDTVSAVPALGEHTTAILSELGYSENQAHNFINQGVV